MKILTIDGFLSRQLGLTIDRELEILDWLVLPEQKLLSVTRGGVFRDDLGLETKRTRLKYFPHDVWLYKLASQWMRLGQEEAFVGRAGDVGDELGSAVVGARIIRDLMKLCFLIERTYAPYSKWFGTAFNQLKSAPLLTDIFQNTLAAGNWKERERWLTDAYQTVAQLQNELGLMAPIETGVVQYFSRPYLVIRADRFALRLREQIQDPFLRRAPLIGSIDQFVDSTDVLEHPELCERIKSIYGLSLRNSSQ